MGKSSSPGLPYNPTGGQMAPTQGPFGQAIAPPQQPPGTQSFGGGGGGGKKSTPAPPDYYGAAQGTSNAGKDIAQYVTGANRPDISTPFGGQQWSQGPDGQWHMSTSLGGPLSGAANSLESQFANNFSTPLDNGSAARDKAINSMYGQATSRLDPQWNQKDEQLKSQLANQGLDSGSQAYQNAEGSFSRDRNDAYTSAMASAIAGGNEAQNLTFNQNLATKFAPLQGLQGLQGFLNMPGFNAATPWQAPNYLDAARMAGQYGLDATGQDKQMWADIIGGASQAGASAIKASDERLKQNIVHLDGEAIPGVPFVEFEYKSQPGVRHKGVIAQDVERAAPEHVLTDGNGTKLVNYSSLYEHSRRLKNG